MTESKKGTLYATTAFTLWGLYPLYWRLLGHVSPFEILVNRIIWSFVTVVLVLIAMRRLSAIKAELQVIKKNPKRGLLVVLAGMFIGLNWGFFTWAVDAQLLLHISLGYYINPLLNVLIGVVCFKEKLGRWQVLAVLLALLGVGYLALSYGTLPWLSLLLAGSFGFYSVAKKMLKMDVFVGLFFESLVLLPLGLFFSLWWGMQGTLAFGTEGVTSWLLFGAGFITLSPLYFFSKGAPRIPLSTLGFLQFIGPTLQVLLAVFITGEYFSQDRFISFLFVWAGCLVFAGSSLLEHKQAQAQPS